MENRAHALIAGLFVLLLGLGILLAVWWFGGKTEASRELVLVTRNSVTGLNPQAQVRYRGIRAGKVLDIGLDPQDPRSILVRISVAARLPLTRGVTAQLNYQGVTGLAYVQLDDSGKSSERLPDIDPPPRVELKSSLFETLGERANVIMGQAGEIAANLKRLTDEHGHLNHALENLAGASDSFKDLPQVMAGVRQALSAENLKRLNAILGALDRTAGEAAPLAVDLRALVASVATLSRRIDQVVADTGGQISGTTLPRVDALVRDLDGNSRQLTRLLDKLEAAPQSLLFGSGRAKAGPGEAGFAPPPIENTP